MRRTLSVFSSAFKSMTAPSSSPLSAGPPPIITGQGKV